MNILVAIKKEGRATWVVLHEKPLLCLLCLLPLRILLDSWCNIRYNSTIPTPHYYKMLMNIFLCLKTFFNLKRNCNVCIHNFYAQYQGQCLGNRFIFQNLTFVNVLLQQLHTQVPSYVYYYCNNIGSYNLLSWGWNNSAKMSHPNKWYCMQKQKLDSKIAFLELK